ncbi:MAG: hypothetical protein ABR567_14665 [Myxococcales bacterium]|nr:hypothetical protein [Myxococcales bacterium]
MGWSLVSRGPLWSRFARGRSSGSSGSALKVESPPASMALVVPIASATPTMGLFHCADVCVSVLCETLRSSNYFSQTSRSSISARSPSVRQPPSSAAKKRAFATGSPKPKKVKPLTVPLSRGKSGASMSRGDWI